MSSGCSGSLGEFLVRSTPVFNQTFFVGEFAEKTREFVRAHGGLGIAVEFVTLGGERLDVLEIQAIEGEGMTLVTRDERLVFLPYAQLAHVAVMAQRDHRTASFQLLTNAP